MDNSIPATGAGKSSGRMVERIERRQKVLSHKFFQTDSQSQYESMVLGDNA
jgi:hypothetical protein